MAKNPRSRREKGPAPVFEALLLREGDACLALPRRLTSHECQTDAIASLFHHEIYTSVSIAPSPLRFWHRLLALIDPAPIVLAHAA